MTIKQYRQARIVVAIYVSMTVSIALSSNNNVLSVIGVLTGLLFMIALRKRTKIIVDERIVSISEKAARYTYSIVTPVMGLGSFMLYAFGKSMNEQILLAGMVLSYVTLFILGTYSVAYYFLNRKYGAGNEE